MKQVLAVALSFLLSSVSFADARIVFGDNADDPTGPMIHVPVGSVDDPTNSDIEFKLNDGSILRFDVQAGSSQAIVKVLVRSSSSHLPYELADGSIDSFRKLNTEFDNTTCTLKLDGDTYTSDNWYIDWEVVKRLSWGATDITAKLVCNDLAKQ